MGNGVWSLYWDQEDVPVRTPEKKVVFFPNTCTAHIQTGVDANCSECQVFQWYRQRVTALQAVAMRQLKCVRDKECDDQLDEQARAIESVLKK